MSLIGDHCFFASRADRRFDLDQKCVRNAKASISKVRTTAALGVPLPPLTLVNSLFAPLQSNWGCPRRDCERVHTMLRVVS
jgi:hypothetical protein